MPHDTAADGSAYRLPIRVISDLHLGHSGCLIDEISQLRSLIEGAGTVIFNGDTIEQRAELFLEKSAALFDDLKSLCAEVGADTVFLTGNHDPGITDVHYLDLLGGKVVVTHGDAFYHLISPWSKKIELSRGAIDAIMAEYSPDDLRDLDTRMEATKRCCWKMSVFESELKKSFVARAWTLAAECWPPHRPWAIVTSWMTAKRRAFDFLDTYRPEAKVLLFGHTHFPMVGRKAGRTVANTGGFLAVLNARLVEIDTDGIFVATVTTDKGMNFIREGGRGEPIG